MRKNQEKLRVEVVKQFKKLDLGIDKELQKIVSQAALVCDVPVSAITLLDEDTQYLKVKLGLAIDETDKDLSFCIHTIKSDQLLIVSDMEQDKRFYDHPFVIDGPKLKFYAGAPLLTSEGFALGTLCVLDFKPQVLNEEQKLILTVLSKHVVSIMELKLSISKLDINFLELQNERQHRISNEIKLRSMFESFSDAYYLWGKNGEIIDFNRAAFEVIKEKHGKELAYGDVIMDFYSPYTFQFIRDYNKALKGERIQNERLADYGGKGIVWWECVFEPIYNAEQVIIGVSYVTRDITERKLNMVKINEQNGLLAQIAEIQSHDYRGPVASIIGLMNLISDDNYVASKEYLMMLESSVNQLDGKIREVVNLVNDPKLNFLVR
jgi:PAS domain S-box-containing protein